jgi:hypothetical protein
VTFTELVADICDRLNLTSTDSQTRIGREVNRYYRRVRTALGLPEATVRAVAVSASKSLGSATVTFSGMQKVTRVYDATSGTNRYLKEVHWDQLRDKNPGTVDPTEWATQSADEDSVTIRINVLAQDTDALLADGFLTTTNLSGSQSPEFPADFHDVLIDGVLADEYVKRNAIDYAKLAKQNYESRLSDLRMWFATSLTKTVRQGELAPGMFQAGAGASGGGGGAPSGGTSYTQTGLVTFDRDPSAPFAVSASSAVVTNLDADKLDGLEASAFATAADLTAAEADIAAVVADLAAHEADVANPHAVTKTQVGLSNVPNTDATNASNISSGTLPDGRFPATLPAASGANLTALNPANVAAGTFGVILSNSAQPRARAYNSAAQSVNNATLTALTLDSEDYDVGAMHDNVTNNSRMTIPTGGNGLYLLVAKTTFASNGTGAARELRLTKNGAAIGTSVLHAPTAAANEQISVTGIEVLVATDYIEAYVYQDSGGALNVGAATRVSASELSIVKLY